MSTGTATAESVMPPILARAAHAGDRRNFLTVEATRLPTSAVYAWFNREQDRYINQQILGRIRKKLEDAHEIQPGSDIEFVTAPSADAPVRTDLQAQPTGVGVSMGHVYNAVGDGWSALAKRVGLGKVLAADETYDTAKFHVRYTNALGETVTRTFEESITTGEKYGRTVDGFATGALMNNFQRSVLKVVEMGDEAPWLNHDGSLSPSTLIRWVGQEAFRGIFKGAGEDVFASWPVYNKAGKLWIDHVAKPVSQWAHTHGDGATTGNWLADGLNLLRDKALDVGIVSRDPGSKSLIEHAIEWQGKFYLYNVFTNMWRDFYDGTLGAIERWVGGKRNNANHTDEGREHKGLIGCITDGFCNLGRGIIRPFVKQFAPMMVSTPFFWLAGHYGTNMSGGSNSNPDTYSGERMPSRSRYGEVAHNPLDAAGKAAGKAWNDFGANVADPAFHSVAQAFGKTPEQMGLDGYGREMLDAYARYGTYFSMKGWAQEQWASKKADKAVDQMIDGFFGTVTNTLLPWRWGRVKESGAKFREGARTYRDILTFRDPETIETARRHMAAKAERASGTTHRVDAAHDHAHEAESAAQPVRWSDKEAERKKQREATPGMAVAGQFS